MCNECKNLDMVELYETKSFEEANKYLKLGWKLITTHIYDFGDPMCRNQHTVYCLAWPISLGKVIKPESEYSRVR